MAVVENHRINLSKINDEKALQYIAGFKRYSTERVMKSLVGEFTQNEKWQEIIIRAMKSDFSWNYSADQYAGMYSCVSEHPDSLRCGRPEVENGDEKIRMLIQSAEVQRVIGKVGL